MKYFILLSLTVLSANTFADYKCPRKVDAKRVVLFVNANSSAAEVENAKKAACERGDTFKEIPDKNSFLDASYLQKELNALAKSNVAVASMIVSGHNGGGSVHGTQGGVNKDEIISAMKSAYKSKPDLLAQFNSVFMWGCWTMGPSEVDVWRTEMPSLKMAAGFFEMGPLNTTLASRTVLHDLLVKEKAISLESDKAKVKRAIASIPTINQTYASVYAESCGTDLYYYRTNGASSPDGEDPNFAPGEHFVEYGKTFSCDGLGPEIEKNRVALMNYYRGSTPIPKDTGRGELRQIYSFVRSHAKCLKPNHVLNGDRILMLIFSENVKANFSDVFADEIAKATAEFDHLKNFLAKYNPKGADMQAFKKYFQAGARDFKKLDKESIKNMDRKQLRSMISYLDGMTKQSIIKKDPKFAGNVKSLKKIKNALENYLFQMNPNCMDFLEWHEADPWSKPQAHCPI